MTDPAEDEFGDGYWSATERAWNASVGPSVLRAADDQSAQLIEQSRHSMSKETA